jgi:hypothetical protein
MNKQDFLDLLVTNILLVTFTKKDGTTRNLKCTLQNNFLEDYYKNTPKATSTRRVPDNQVCCLDLEINEFRSFLIESVIEYQIL